MALGLTDLNYDILDSIASLLPINSYPRDLLQLMKTCWLLHHTCLRYLLHEVVLDDEIAAERFGYFIRCRVESGRHVRKLELNWWLWPDQEKWGNMLELPKERRKWLADAVADMIEACPNLESLHIQYLEEASTLCKRLPAAVKRCARLSEVHFTDDNDGLGDHCVDVLRSLRAPLRGVTLCQMKKSAALWKSLASFAETLQSVNLGFAVINSSDGLTDVVWPKVWQLELYNCMISTALLERAFPNVTKLRVWVDELWALAYEDDFDSHPQTKNNAEHRCERWRRLEHISVRGIQGLAHLALTGCRASRLTVESVVWDAVDVEQLCVLLRNLRPTSYSVEVALEDDGYSAIKDLDTCGVSLDLVNLRITLLPSYEDPLRPLAYLARLPMDLSRLTALKGLDIVVGTAFRDRFCLRDRDETPEYHVDMLLECIPSVDDIEIEWRDAGWASVCYERVRSETASPTSMVAL